MLDRLYVNDHTGWQGPVSRMSLEAINKILSGEYEIYENDPDDPTGELFIERLRIELIIRSL
jgi:hypothetical protein